MGNNNLSKKIHRNFPLRLSSQLEKLPDAGKEEFLVLYSQNIKNLGLAYLFHFILGTSYLYQGKIFKQLLFWLTGFGFAVGWVINLFRMPGVISRLNYGKAQKIIFMLNRKYKIRPRQKPKDSLDFIKKRVNKKIENQAQKKPRVFAPPYDPTQIKVENLKTGFMLDYQFKTWDVTGEFQYDWEDGSTEKNFKIKSGLDTVLINVKPDDQQFKITHFERINFYAISNALEIEIHFRDKPRNIFEFQGEQFYRENTLNGIYFNLSEKNIGTRVKVWEFLNADRNEIIRIEKTGAKEIRTFKGKNISPFEFSEILPRVIYS
ncbi:DUF4178 domain-containing protein [Flexithrix dorotheae]|uniref:DUF4178 domain-containing protein n=1 Tax=Flexithrix dorotheae TaxID=70993 RepID=UPI000367D8AA|nr:DUF4178 domain-containing protein [Flexithrix dorotheae]